MIAAWLDPAEIKYSKKGVTRSHSTVPPMHPLGAMRATAYSEVRHAPPHCLHSQQEQLVPFSLREEAVAPDCGHHVQEVGVVLRVRLDRGPEAFLERKLGAFVVMITHRRCFAGVVHRQIEVRGCRLRREGSYHHEAAG